MTALVLKQSVFPLGLSFVAAFVAAFVVAGLFISQSPESDLWFGASLIAAVAASGLVVTIRRHVASGRRASR